jgi:LCP family protein required for cell wall assembly
MDRSKYKRPDIQKQSQITKNTFGNSVPVPKVSSSRPIGGIDGIGAARPLRHGVASPPQSARPPVSYNDAGKPTLGSIAVSGQAGASGLTPAVLAARRVPIDMDLPGEDSSWRLGSLVKQRGFRRRLARSAAVVVVLMITMGGLLFSQTYLKLHQVFKGSTGTAAALQTDVKPELLKGEGRGRVNILLLGRGGGTHEAPDLTDTIMIASVDPVNKTATLLSLPRDLWVNVPDRGVMKINAAWQSGVYKYYGGKMVNNTTDPNAVKAGFASVDQTLQDVLGLTIDYNVMVDFKAFQQAVDTVGGVNVNVPADLVDPTMAWENANNPVLAKAGPQAFDGKHALIYARSRETSSDFARAERQRSLLLGLKSKVVNLGTLSNPLKISKLISSFGNNVQTDLSLNNASRLYNLTKGIKENSIASLSLAEPTNPLVTTGNVNGQSVVLPKSGLFDYKAIQDYVRSQLKDPYIMRERAKIMILNGTLTPGLASTRADELKSFGYNVTSVGNAPSSGWLQTTLIDVTHKNKYTKNYLEQRLGVEAADSLNDKTIATNGADFVMIIGSNEVNTSLHQTR